MQSNLIYDVGMHNGDDTAFYLHLGYRVLAIEADPVQAEAGRQRFATAIAAGQLTILEVAIGPERGVVPFWISTNPEYNSFDRANASRWGHSCRAIEVPCWPFADVLAEYGTPYYLKIDIEGADHYCLEAIDPAVPPRYVSFEKYQLKDLFTARDRGYSRFKLIGQKDFRQLMFRPGDGSSSGDRRSRLGRWASRLIRHPQFRWSGQLARRMHLLDDPAASRRDRGDDTWRFPFGSSGPFGDEADGPWRTLEEVTFSWLAFDLGYTGKDPELDDWFDIHCALY